MHNILDKNCLRQPEYWAESRKIEHLPFLFWLLPILNPKRCIEIGTDASVAYFAVCQAVRAASLSTECVSLGDWKGHQDDPRYLDLAFHNRKNFRPFSEIRQSDPLEFATSVEDRQIDLLIFGGSPSGEVAERLLENWSRKLSDTAITIIFGTRDLDNGLSRIWQRLSAQKPSLEFPWSGGLGVVANGAIPEPRLAELFAAAAVPTERTDILDTFEACGKNLRLQFEHASSAPKGKSVAHPEEDPSEFEQNWHRSRSQIDSLNLELARARRRPLKTLGDYLKFKLLNSILALPLPIPEAAAARFERSAIKRDPNRSLNDDISSHQRSGIGQSRLRKQQSAFGNNASRGDSGRPVKNTILIVSHEASRTGAPILAWNLASELSKSHDVVNLVLGGGDLRKDFESSGAAFYEIDRRKTRQKKINKAVRQICARHQISYALVNSVESRCVLPGLNQSGVPSVALLHEFAAYTRPPSAFPDIARHADKLVFSTRITFENASSTCRLSRGASVHILPQGKCVVPPSGGGIEEQEKERTWLEQVLRPQGARDGEFVVIGAGYVEPRKAVDLFIECAARVVSTPGGGRFRFVWIGNGYDPKLDVRLSGYLSDQITRAGLQGNLKVIRATSEIEHAYALADLLLLSSRLDPLPNVAIDALVAGTPVACFDRTTGIAEFLVENDLGEACVAPYLDTSEMARKIIALAADEDRRRDVARRGMEAGRRVFNFKSYAANLDRIAQAVEPRPLQIARDAEFLGEDGSFREDFFCASAEDISKEAAIEEYLLGSWSSTFLRKPIPGFNPGVFSEVNNLSLTGEPFVAYLKAGRPPGPWAYPVICSTSPAPDSVRSGSRIALHIHAYYLGEANAILKRLAANSNRPDLFVSTRAEQVEEAQELFSHYAGTVMGVCGFPNRGRDIGPFLTGFGRRLTDEYDIVGHIHTKKSLVIEDRSTVESWKVFLMENLLGGEVGGAMMDRILGAMQGNDEIAIVFPDDPNVLSWTENKGAAENIAARMGINRLPDQFSFPIGSMFWMRTASLKDFVQLNLQWSDYPAEPVPYDGTMLHALERLFGVIPPLKGKKAVVTNVPGLSR